MIQPQSSAQETNAVAASVHVLIQPGWQNSGPHHWQTFWQSRLGNAATRVPQHDWMVPERDAWVRTLVQTMEQASQPVVILAHSVGCLATVFALQSTMVAAVVLVAPADTERPSAPEPLRSFTPIPMQPLPAPALVIASDDDPYCTLERAGAFAQAWRADLEVVPNAGHINGETGYGPWPEGWQMVSDWLKRHGLTLPVEEVAGA